MALRGRVLKLEAGDPRLVLEESRNWVLSLGIMSNLARLWEQSSGLDIEVRSDIEMKSLAFIPIFYGSFGFGPGGLRHRSRFGCALDCTKYTLYH